MANQDLNFVIKAQNSASAALKAVSGDLDKLDSSSSKASGTIGKLGGALGDMAKIAGGFVIGQGLIKLPGLLTSMTKSAVEDAAATDRLQQSIKNLGGDFDAISGKVNAAIANGQRLAFTDDQVRDSFQQLAAATGDADEALRRQALAMDFSRGAGIGLEQASKLLGKVTEENVEAFKRMGITIGEGASEAEAFAVIQAKFGGQSEAFAKSAAGQFAQAKIAMAELGETIGALLLPMVTKIGTTIVQYLPQIQAFADTLIGAVSTGISGVAAGLERLAAVVINTEQFERLANIDWSGLVGAVGANFGEGFQKASDAVRQLWTALQPVLEYEWSQLQPVIAQLGPAFADVGSALKELGAALEPLLPVLGPVLYGLIVALTFVLTHLAITLINTLVVALKISEVAILAVAAAIPVAIAAYEHISGFITGTVVPAALAVGDAFTTGMDAAKAVVTTTISTIEGVLNTFLGFLNQWTGNIAGYLSAAAAPFMTFFEQAARPIEWLIQRFEWLADRIRSLPSPNISIPGAGGGVPFVPGFARGGRAPGGMAVVGEQGPELVSLPAGSFVHTASQSSNIISMARAMGIPGFAGGGNVMPWSMRIPGLAGGGARGSYTIGTRPGASIGTALGPPSQPGRPVWTQDANGNWDWSVPAAMATDAAMGWNPDIAGNYAWTKGMQNHHWIDDRGAFHFGMAPGDTLRPSNYNTYRDPDPYAAFGYARPYGSGMGLQAMARGGDPAQSVGRGGQSATRDGITLNFNFHGVMSADENAIRETARKVAPIFGEELDRHKKRTGR